MEAEMAKSRPKSNADITRQEILRQIFGNVGELIDDFSCAVEASILLHGRMYITDRFACFYSNLFGLEKKIRIPFAHITVVTKENTALVIPNAIAINTFKKKYIFRSFWDRDHCFFTLKSFISKHSNKTLLTRGDVERNVRQAQYSIKSRDDPLFLGKAADVDAGGTRPLSSSANSSTADTISDLGTDDQDPLNVDVEGNSDDDMDNMHEEEVDNEVGNDGGERRLGFRPLSVDGEGPPYFGVTEVEYLQEAAASTLGKVVVQGTIPISLGEYYSFFVDDMAPHSLLKYHETCGDKQLSCTPWEKIGGALPPPSVDKEGEGEGKSSGSNADNSSVGMTREIKFFKPVNLPGLKSTKGVKVQRLHRFGPHGLIIHSSTRLEDVPAADTFSVEDVICVKYNDDKTVSVDISFEVRFHKRTFIKYVIESSTNTEMAKWIEEFFVHLGHCATARVADRNVKLASIKRVLKPVADDSDDDDDGEKGSPPKKKSSVSKALTSVKKSVHKVVNGMQLHVGDSLDSWSRVEGRRFFVVCFALLFGLCVTMYIEMRLASLHVSTLQAQVADMALKIDVLLSRGR